MTTPRTPDQPATLAERAAREAEIMARVTGSTGATVVYERVALDGTVTVEAAATYARPVAL